MLSWSTYLSTDVYDWEPAGLFMIELDRGPVYLSRDELERGLAGFFRI